MVGRRAVPWAVAGDWYRHLRMAVAGVPQGQGCRTKSGLEMWKVSSRTVTLPTVLCSCCAGVGTASGKPDEHGDGEWGTRALKAG